MAGDWIKVHRSLLDSQQMTDDWLCRLWIWCLLRANFEVSNFRGQQVLPGQFITGRISAAAELHVSPSKWYRGIERLREMGCIEVEANSNWTTLTICNWKTYQECAAKSEQPADSQRTAGDTTSGQPADTIKEGKNGRIQRREESNTPLTPQGGTESPKPKRVRVVPDYMLPQVQAIYEAYPRKVAPDAAYKAIAKALGFIEYEELLRRVRLYADARRRPGQDYKLTPHPATWFNRGSWKEDPAEWQRLDGGSGDLFDGQREYMERHGIDASELIES